MDRLGATIMKDGWSGWSVASYCEAVIGGIILVSVTAAVVWFRRKPYLAVGWFWFLGVLLPVIGIVQVGTQARADRYTYLPMIGISLMVVWLLKEVADRWPKSRLPLAAGSALVLAALSVITFRQVSYWRDSYRLFYHALQVTDDNWFAYNHIGIAYDADARAIDNLDAEQAKKRFEHVSQYFQGPPKYVDPARPQDWAGYSRDDFLEAAKKLNHAQEQQLLYDYSAEAFKATIDIKSDYDFGNNNLGVYRASFWLKNTLKPP
jgi:hypothetical protein